MLSAINSQYSINRDKVKNEVRVGSPISISVEIDTFRRTCSGELPLIDHKLQRFRKRRLRRLRAAIYTSDDRRFQVTFSKAMTEEIRSLVDAYLSKKNDHTGG